MHCFVRIILIIAYGIYGKILISIQALYGTNNTDNCHTNNAENTMHLHCQYNTVNSINA